MTQIYSRTLRLFRTFYGGEFMGVSNEY